jgi:hypothetical protein
MELTNIVEKLGKGLVGKEKTDLAAAAETLLERIK